MYGVALILFLQAFAASPTQAELLKLTQAHLNALSGLRITSHICRHQTPDAATTAGFVAFETARELIGARNAVGFIAMSDREAQAQQFKNPDPGFCAWALPQWLAKVRETGAAIPSEAKDYVRAIMTFPR